MRKTVNIVVVFLIPFFYLLPFKGHAEELDRGKIINKIYCRDDNEYSYALFLPSVYSKEKKWPIIFGLDPGARGRIPVEKFRAAAEKYGYIVVGSNNARNGPWKDFVLPVQVTWADIQGRFQVDPDRIYATGFSGGARGAVVFPFAVKKKLAGIIACGAGLPGRFKPEQVKPAAYI